MDLQSTGNGAPSELLRPPPYVPPRQMLPAASVPLGGVDGRSLIAGYSRDGTAPSADDRSPRSAMGASMAVVGGCLSAAGTFLPWVTADLEDLGTRGGNGWRNVAGSVSWGPGIAFVSLVVVALGTLVICGAGRGSAARVGIFASAILLAMTGAQVWDVARDHPGATTVMGIGPPVMVTGAALALIGMLLAARAESAANVSAGRAVGAVG